jgi:hypothetical protein
MVRQFVGFGAGGIELEFNPTHINLVLATAALGAG